MSMRTFIVVFVVSVMLIGCGNDNGQIGEFRYRSDMYEQPSYRKHEDALPPVEGTVPVGGKEISIPDSAFAARLRNPVARTAANADSGRFLYETYCSPCHGLAAKGDGLVAAKFQVPPDLTTRAYRQTPDGYMYYVIRNGRLIMPSYYEALKARERWLVVNHLRELQAN
jgi:mono/diheme cytochrome c family protein